MSIRSPACQSVRTQPVSYTHRLAGAVEELVIAALRPLRAHIGDVGALHGYEAVLQGGEAVVHKMCIRDRGKAHPRVAPGRSGQFLHGELVQQLAPSGGLLGLGFVGGEAGDKLL